ncbi:MAG: pilus assembly protein PilM [Candidatus Omnitrophica bacterium]|nr:pilus assembly protein PilM [Candidatus Omnitrophota bacterium]
MSELKKPSQTHGSPALKLQFSIAAILSFIKNIFASTQNVIGLDVGTIYIKIVQLQKTRKGYTINNYITRAIPASVRDNPESKASLVTEFVKEFIADARIKTKLGRLVISGKGVFIFSLQVPVLSKKDLKGAISIELKKRLPFQMDLSAISFDYFVTGQVRDERGTNFTQVTCIAAENTLLNESVEFLKQMHIRPIVIGAIPDALANLIPLCITLKPNQAAAILDMGANASLFNFYKGDMLQFSREIPIGGEHFTKALTKSINTANGIVNLNAEDAEKIKRQCGIPLEEEQNTEYFTDFGMLLGSQITTMLRPTLERMITELMRTINYYTKTFHVPAVAGIYLTGGSCRLKNIEKFLLSNLEGANRMERLNTLKAVKGWADTGVLKQELVMEQAAPHLSAAFGICIAGGGRVNLLPVKEKIEQKANFMMVLVKVASPVILFLGILFYTFTYVNSFRYKNLIEGTEFNISKLEPIVARVKEYLALKNKIDQRKDLLEKAVGRQPLWWGMLKELSNITPGEVILSRIITSENKDPLEIRLLGEILAKYTTVDLALSQYLMALDESLFFVRVQLVSTQKDMYSAIPRANFEIVCQLSY